jgi:glycine cleavage system H protein
MVPDLRDHKLPTTPFAWVNCTQMQPYQYRERQAVRNEPVATGRPYKYRVMSDPKFTREHQWLRADAGNSITVGISDYAQQELGDVVYVDLPAEGSRIEADKTFSVIESVKTASDISIPMNGTVTEVNTRLADEPELVNNSPLNEGWLIRMEPENAGALEGLLDQTAYTAFTETLD